MAKRILGLEIGHCNIKLLECITKQKKGQLIIQQAQNIPTPPGCMIDGVIVDVDKVYEVIYEQLKSKKYKAKKLVVVIKGSDIITRDIRMDAMPKKDTKVILSLQYEEYLMVDMSQYQVAFKVVKELEEDGEKKQELLIVAAPNRMIFPLLELADKLKKHVKTINIASDAITHVFSKDDFSIVNGEENDVMVVDIGGQSTTVTIVSEGIGVLNRDIPFGLDAINSMITEEFSTSDLQDVEGFKSQYAAIYDDDAGGNIYGQYISSILKPMMDYQLTSEIRRFLQFHFSRGKNKPIEKVYVVGGGAYLKNIDRYIASALNIPCEAGLQLNTEKVTCSQEFEKQSAYFANILGLVKEA